MMLTEEQAQFALRTMFMITSPQELLKVYKNNYLKDSHPYIDIHVATELFGDSSLKHIANAICARVCIKGVGKIDESIWGNAKVLSCLGRSFLELFNGLVDDCNDDFIKETGRLLLKLAMVYSSRSIDLNPNIGYASYATRALTAETVNQYGEIEVDVFKIPGQWTRGIVEVYAISDYCESSIQYLKHGFLQDASYLRNQAIRLHNWLEDISVGGVDADEYSLEEIAAIGNKRYKVIVDKLYDEHKNGLIELDASYIMALVESI